MAEGISTDIEHLSSYRQLSKRRIVRHDESDAKAAASIPANIAEGSGRGSDIELRRFCHIALGSANELEFFTLLSRDLSYIEGQQYDQLNEYILEIQRMLGSLIQKLGTKRE